ncbi:unnamed protein product [Rangifer tarandus platyrhynchus]|uniref:Uncharacterized protein n=1 Tax=Rangifer tarandus platyrhynchus TaxID=3082113 RepID=A0ABN8Z783_RANTA|nr:unnamed protein product [Rangifer tarandus platyrhynchus]
MRPLCRTLQWDFPGGSDGEASTHNAGDLGSILVLGRSPGGNGNPPQYSWVGKIPWRRKCQPTPVFLPGKSHGLRNLTAFKKENIRHVWQMASIVETSGG